MTFALRFLALACLGAAVVTPTFASENPGTHVHGQASMQVAVEGKRIDVMFKTPTANLLGFEYQPTTGAEHKVMDEARQWLESTPLINTDDSACRIKQASLARSHDDHKGHDDHNEHHEEHHHDAHHDGHLHQNPGEGHSELEVSQSLLCGSAPAENFVTPLLTQYPAITNLSVDWVNDNGQGSTRLKAGESAVRLAR